MYANSFILFLILCVPIMSCEKKLECKNNLSRVKAINTTSDTLYGFWEDNQFDTIFPGDTTIRIVTSGSVIKYTFGGTTYATKADECEVVIPFF